MHPTLDPLAREVLTAVCSHPGCPESLREEMSNILMGALRPRGPSFIALLSLTAEPSWDNVHTRVGEFFEARGSYLRSRVAHAVYSELKHLTAPSAHEPNP